MTTRFEVRVLAGKPFLFGLKEGRREVNSKARANNASALCTYVARGQGLTAICQQAPGTWPTRSESTAGFPHWHFVPPIAENSQTLCVRRVRRLTSGSRMHPICERFSNLPSQLFSPVPLIVRIAYGSQGTRGNGRDQGKDQAAKPGPSMEGR